jgi:hypothetical protein
MSYQPLLLGLGTAVFRTDGSTNILEGETANLRVGQPVVFRTEGPSSIIFGGVVANTVYYIKEIVDSNQFKISATPTGGELELSTVPQGFMLVRPVQKELVGESLRKVDEMLEEIYNGGLAGDGVGILALQDDETPVLGGSLNLNNNSIVGTGDITITGTVDATLFVGKLTGTVEGNLAGILDPELGQQDPTISGQKIFALNARDGQSLTWNASAGRWQPGFRLPSYTTEERDLETWVNGDMIYNTTLNKLQGYQNGAWVSLASDFDGGTASTEFDE